MSGADALRFKALETRVGDLCRQVDLLVGEVRRLQEALQRSPEIEAAAAEVAAEPQPRHRRGPRAA